MTAQSNNNIFAVTMISNTHCAPTQIRSLTMWAIITGRNYFTRSKGSRTVIPDEQSKKFSNDQELIQSDPTSCPQNQKGNN